MGGGKEIVAAGFKVGLAPAMRNGTAVMDDSTGASFQIFGADSQIVEVTLAPGASLLSQPGNLVHMDNCFDAKVKTGGLYPAFRRSRFGGESFFRCKYTNKSKAPATIGLTPHFPAKVVPVNLSEMNGLTIKNGAFLAALDTDCDIGVKWVNGVGVGLFGGQGLLLNRLKGKGYAFQNTVKYDIEGVGGAGMVFFGGQDLFNTVMTGP